MKFLVAILIVMGFTLILGSKPAISSKNLDHLFSIERSTNRNVVRYDAALTDENGLSWPSPVSAYWIMENGSRQELNFAEKKYAYGISSQEKVDREKLSFYLAALKGRSITVERIEGSFRAVASIGGKQSVVERVHIEAASTWLGVPKVVYLDVFGRDLRTNVPVKERIFPGGDKTGALAG